MLSPWIGIGLLIAAGTAPIGDAAAQTPQRAPLPPGQVWQCSRDGHMTFSDAPCGAGATIRQLADINVMDPTPVAHGQVHPTPPVAYAPYPGSYRDDQLPTNTADATNAANGGDPVYGIQVVGIATAWQRVRRPPRPSHQEHPLSRAHAGHAAGR